MKGIRKKPFIVLFCVICISLFLPACALFNKRLIKDPFHLQSMRIVQYPASDAQTALEKIHRKNLGVKTIKGVGTFSFDHQNERFASRLAWTGLRQGDQVGKIRLEVIGPHGQPVASLAANETAFYFFSHVERKFYEKALTDRSLETYLKIPITVNEMVNFLSGRIPLDHYDQIALTQNGNGEGFILYGLKKDSKTVIKLFLDDAKETVYKAEYFHSVSKFSFRVEFIDPKLVDAYKIPFQIKIVDDKGSDFILKMDRVWANATVDESIFTLSQPE